MSDYMDKRKKDKLNASSVVYAGKVIIGTANVPDPKMALGLDPSHWSNVIDFQKAKENGISFAIIKAKNGVNNVNFWKENYKGAKDAGILVGAYLWLYPQVIASPGRQAREFAKLLQDYPIDLPPAIDFEWTYSKNPTCSDLWGCTQPLKELVGKEPIIYTAPGYWNEYGTYSAIFQNNPLWQAQYKVTVPNKMRPWGGWSFWQWTDQGDGAKYGFRPDGEKKVTLNYWKGTLDELKAFCGKG